MFMWSLPKAVLARPSNCRSGLARDPGPAVYQIHGGVAIAGKTRSYSGSALARGAFQRLKRRARPRRALAWSSTSWLLPRPLWALCALAVERSAMRLIC
ncbi:hypothetical protein D3C76_999370 [compost metagenome]